MNTDDLLSFKDFPPANVIGGGGGGGSGGGARRNNSDNMNQQQQQQQQQQYNNSMRSGSGSGGNTSNVAELKLYSPNRNINPFANPSIQSGLPASSTGYNQQSSSVLSGDPLDNLINDMQTSIDIMNTPPSSSSSMEQNAPQSQQNDQQQSQDKTNSIGYSFFTIEYYQQYFNVDTEIVLERIRSAIIPRRASITYLEKQIGTNPDLYGPFWIVMTLIFSIAISGNLSNYLQSAENDYRWQYNFHLVSYAATTIFLYVCFVPLGLWGAFKWFVKQTDQESDSSYTPSLLTLICIYGYSMVIYIPVSILWVIQISFLQWILVISAAFLSGSVLIIILTPALRVSKISLIIAIGIVAAHFLMAASFMLYFFHVPNSHNEIVYDNVIVKQSEAATVIKEAIVKNLTAAT